MTKRIFTYAGNDGKMSHFNHYYSSDEYFTNIRGLTAIQNCEDLKNSIISYDRSTKDKYKSIAEKINKPTTNDEYTYFEFLKKMVDYATMKSWNRIKSFLAITKEDGKVIPYADLNENSNENIQAFAWINEELGTNYAKTDKRLKMTNTLRRLYKLANNEQFDASRKNSFKNFLKDGFGDDLLKKIFDSLK